MRTTRRMRSNPREKSDLGKPWDVVPPTEDLPGPVAAVVHLANLKKHLGWCGAWAPRMAGRTAHIVAQGSLGDELQDAMVAVGFVKGGVLAAHWLWREDGAPVKTRALPKRLTLEAWRTATKSRAMLLALAEHGMLAQRQAILGAAACVRYALRWHWLMDPERVEMDRYVRGIEFVEAFCQGGMDQQRVRDEQRAYAELVRGQSTAMDHAVVALMMAASRTDSKAALKHMTDALNSAVTFAINMRPTGLKPSWTATRKILDLEFADVVRFRVEPPPIVR